MPKTTNITVAIDSEKLAALRQYAAKKDTDLEAELRDAIEILFTRLVPAAVREYIEFRAETEPPRR
jgi:hypothetical protein